MSTYTKERYQGHNKYDGRVIELVPFHGCRVAEVQRSPEFSSRSERWKCRWEGGGINVRIWNDP